MPLTPSQRTLDEDASPSFCAGRKLGEVEQALLWTLLHEDPECPSRVLLAKVGQRQLSIAVRMRPLNRWRVTWQRNRRRGRPRQSVSRPSVPSQGGGGQVVPPLAFVGVHLLAHGLEQQGAFAPVGAQLQQAIETHTCPHPDDDFALGHHREPTLRHRVPAVFFAPLFGIEPLTAFATREHPLPTRRGHGYHSAPLSQFLGQLERVDAAQALMPTLVPESMGPRTSVDGHMSASWSRRAMHKGTITRLGRLMAGSHAVIAHDETGQALFVASSPPALHLSQVIMASCQQVVAASGSPLFGIDRAVNAVAMARAFAEQGWGLLCLLNDNEPQGLESFEATEVSTREDGTRLSSGPWKVARPDDPRHVVVVEPAAGQLLVSWGTPQVVEALEATAWPGVSRARPERQENSVKGMIGHGALDIHYGRKQGVGPDRHQQRARAQLDQSRDAAQKRVAKKADAVHTQHNQVAASESTGPGKRLAQRQRALAEWEKELEEAPYQRDQRVEQAAALGPPRQRADRDFRTQTIMTLRTLWLENTLRAFVAVLLGMLQTKVSLEQVLRLLFARRGARMETRTHVVYWLNTAGVSLPYRRLLAEMVDGLCAMDLRDHGKGIRVCLKDMPP